MKAKKHPKANVDKLRSSIFFGGLVFSLAFVLVSFQWTSWTGNNDYTGQMNGDLEIPEEILVTITEVAPPPPPPPAPSVEIIIANDDDDVIETVVEIQEITETTEIKEILEDEEIIDEILPPVKFAEKMPMFPGGEEELFRFLGEGMKYPAMARDAGISGRVFVTFVVEKNGAITNIDLLRGIGGGCDEEAMRVVESMPKWTPGKQGGKNVRVQFNLPIFFNLR